MTVAIAASANGFQPARLYNNDHVRQYPVSNDGSTTLAIGDVVAIVAGVATKLLLTDSPTYPVSGVVIGLLNSNGRPLTFNQPTLGNYLPISTTGFAQVLMDADMTYTVLYTGTSATSLVGTNVRAADAGVTAATGVSGMSTRALASSDATTTPFKVIGVSDELVAGGTGTNKYVEVGLNNTWRRAGTLAQ